MIQKVEHSISYKSIFAIVLLVVGFYLAIKLASLLFLTVVAFMLASALQPLVKKLNAWLPFWLAVAIVIIGVLFPVIAIISIGIPSLLEQGPATLNKINEVVNSIKLLPESVRSSINLGQSIQDVGGYLLNSLSTITNLMTAVGGLIFLTIYLLLDRSHLKKILIALVPKDHRKQTQALMSEFARVSGNYIRGSILMSLICGIVIFIGLVLLKVPGAFILAVFAGIVDLLPIVGFIIGAVPAALIAFSISPTTGIIVLVIFIIYGQLKNQILAPIVYSKTLSLSPVISLLAVFAGAILYGIPGTFVALPLAATIPALVDFIQKYK